MTALSEAAVELARNAVKLVRENVDKLRAGSAPNEIEQNLWDWATVLGVLSQEILESTVLLLNSLHTRAANMLSRGIADYDIRLRYYIVQYKFAEAQQLGRGRALQATQVDAIKHWQNGGYKMGKVLNLYQAEFWPDELHKKLAKIAESDNKEINLNFTHAVNFLHQNEVEVLGINVFFATAWCVVMPICYPNGACRAPSCTATR